MAEKTVPWWRRALQFALGGIRSGFGLFHRGERAGELEDEAPGREVGAAEAAEVTGGVGVVGVAIGQGSKPEQPRENEGKTEQDEMAKEIPMLVTFAQVNRESASSLPEDEVVGDEIEGAEIEPIESVPVGIEHAAAEIDGIGEKPVQLAKEAVGLDAATPAVADVEAPEDEPTAQEAATEEPESDEMLAEESVREWLTDDEPVVIDRTQDEPSQDEQAQDERNGDQAIPMEETVEATVQFDVVEDPLRTEPAAENENAETAEPLPVGAHEERVEEAEELEPAVEFDDVELAEMGSSVVEELVEAAEMAASREVVDAAMDKEASAIEGPVPVERAEELEAVKLEGTVVTAEAIEPAEDQVESLQAAEVHVEEPVESAQKPGAEAVVLEEHPGEDRVEFHALTGVPAIEEPMQVVAEVTNEIERAEPVEDHAKDTRQEPIVETVASEADEGPVGGVAEVTGDGEGGAAVKERANGGEEVPILESVAADADAAEWTETPREEETAPDTEPAEREAAQAASAEISSIPSEAEIEEIIEARAEAEPEAETAAQAAPEAVNAPAQLELIPKPPVDEKTAARLAELQKRRKQAEEESPFSVMVGQVYEGPLDLLLDLIRKQDIDVYDIPIAKITAQFLAYVNQLKASDVDVAGEFIYTASLLIHIKSKMLLPRTVDGPGETPEDPRRELVERLLEHERFKNAAQMLQQKQMMEAASWSNPGNREFKDDEGAEPEIAADTVDLVRVFREILERARNRPVMDVTEDTVTVGQMIRFLGRRLLMEDKPIALRKLLSQTRSERALIAMFLALLELVRLQAILLRQDRAFSEIFVKKHAAFETVMDEGLTNARDDWR